jgi:hypothetical protein
MDQCFDQQTQDPSFRSGTDRMAGFDTKARSSQTGSDADVRRYLRASAEQIRLATAETQTELDGMARLVISLARHVVGMSAQLDRLEERSLRPEDMKAVRDEVSSLDAVSNKTIARLQFAERLNRRLVTVQKNLSALAGILSDDSDVGAASGSKRSKLRLTAAQQERLMQEIVDEDAANDAHSKRVRNNVTWVSDDGWGKLKK